MADREFKTIRQNEEAKKNLLKAAIRYGLSVEHGIYKEDIELERLKLASVKYNKSLTEELRQLYREKGMLD